MFALPPPRVRNQGRRVRAGGRNQGGAVRGSERDANRVSVLSRDKCSRTVWFALFQRPVAAGVSDGPFCCPDGLLPTCNHPGREPVARGLQFALTSPVSKQVPPISLLHQMFLLIWQSGGIGDPVSVRACFPSGGCPRSEIAVAVLSHGKLNASFLVVPVPSGALRLGKEALLLLRARGARSSSGCRRRDNPRRSVGPCIPQHCPRRHQ